MLRTIDRRSLLKITGMSLGIGALMTVAPGIVGKRLGRALADELKRRNGEAPQPFSFVQLSDTHVGFHGPPDPLGTRAFEAAVKQVAALRTRPDLVIVTGDLTHDADDPAEHARRMRRFKEIAAGLGSIPVKVVPGENDAALDGGQLFREHFGETHYSFDHRGIHFIALDNVSRGRPEVGVEQLAWLKRDLARFPTSAPIVVFTHRPLFDLKPDWEWFTSDGAGVMNALAPYENVTVLYGHIHREHFDQLGRARHYAARSLIFAFPDPATTPAKKPLPFDAAAPFKDLGIRVVKSEAETLAVNDVRLDAAKFSGTVGVTQMLKGGHDTDE